MNGWSKCGHFNLDSRGWCPRCNCDFCKIVYGELPAEVVAGDVSNIVIKPLNPVTPGHLLVIPKAHVVDFTEEPYISGKTMEYASNVARGLGGEFNLITSKGPAATQSVFHMHLHLVPRVIGDGLHLPWTDQHIRRQSTLH